MSNGIILSIFFLLMLIFSGFIITSITSVILIPISFTPQRIIKELVDIISPKKGESFADLGSGDGRLLLAIAKRERIKGDGYDISPIMVLLANMRRFISFNFKGNRYIKFEVASMFDVNLSNYDKIYCHLSYKAMQLLDQKFRRELKGTIVYSYAYEIGNKKIENTYELSNGRKLFEYHY